MDPEGRLRLLRELWRLGGRLVGPGASPLRQLGALRALLTEAADSTSAEDLDALLLWTAAAGARSATLPPVQLCLLALGAGARRGLTREERVDVALAAALSPLGARRVADERLSDPEGGAIGPVLLRLVQCGQERLDGGGPLGLSSADFDEPARLLAALCAYDARVRGPAKAAPHRALAELWADAAGFSRDCSRSLARLLSAFPHGTSVRLTDGSGAVVVAADPQDPMRPVVVIGERAGGERVEPPLRCELAREPGLAVAALPGDPAAPAPAPGEPVEAWLDRLAAAARPAGSARPAAEPPAGAAVSRAELAFRLSAALGAGVGSALSGLEEAVHREEDELRQADAEASLRRSRDRERRDSELDREAAEAGRELASVQERLAEEERRLAESRASLEAWAGGGALLAQAAARRARLAELTARREACARARADLERREGRWADERDARELELRRHLELLRRQRAALRTMLQDRLDRVTAARLSADARAAELARELESALAADPGDRGAEALLKAAARREFEGLAEALARQLAALDAGLEEVRGAEAALEARARDLEQEEARVPKQRAEAFQKARRELRERLPVAPLRRELRELERRCRDEARRLLERQTALLESRERRWRAERDEAELACTARLDGLRRRRAARAQRVRAQIEALREAALAARAQLEAGRSDLAARLEAVRPTGEALGRLHAAQLGGDLEREENARVAAALQAELAALGKSVEESRRGWEVLDARARALDEEQARVRARLRGLLASARRRLREEVPLAAAAAQWRELRATVRRLDAERSGLSAEWEEKRALKATGARSLERLKRRLERSKEAWARERATLEKALQDKRRELHALRARALAAREEGERRALEADAEAKGKAEALTSRLRQLRRRRRERAGALEAGAVTLREELSRAQRELAAASETLGRERERLEAAVLELRGACGEAQGLLAAHAAEVGPLRHSLQAALSELDVKLLEGRLAAERLGAEARELATAQTEQFRSLEQVSSQFDSLAAEFSAAEQGDAARWEDWARLAQKGLGPAADSVREELLSRARGLRSWQRRVGELAERVAAVRDTVETRVVAACMDAASAAFQAGDLPAARERLRRALSLRADPAGEALLKQIEARLSSG
ncbi:MAG: hypothetical protein HY554_09890 [Elusimicrobia bacterium]|nr:hypothetical protein [Elusimicrobiota bacterium]